MTKIIHYCNTSYECVYEKIISMKIGYVKSKALYKWFKSTKYNIFKIIKDIIVIRLNVWNFWTIKSRN